MTSHRPKQSRPIENRNWSLFRADHTALVRNCINLKPGVAVPKAKILAGSTKFHPDQNCPLLDQSRPTLWSILPILWTISPLSPLSQQPRNLHLIYLIFKTLCHFVSLTLMRQHHHLHGPYWSPGPSHSDKGSRLDTSICSVSSLPDGETLGQHHHSHHD